jgi:hypothetical protein
LDDDELDAGGGDGGGGAGCGAGMLRTSGGGVGRAGGASRITGATERVSTAGCVRVSTCGGGW